MSGSDVLFAPVNGADHRNVNGVLLDVVRAGKGRIKRTIYPAGFRWVTGMKDVAHTDLCMHAHIGFIVCGHVQVRFPDGCTMDFTAPSAVVIEPGHVGWVVGDEAAVLIEVDFEGDTAQQFGLPETHRHD
ncbi:MAG: hypothetical protein NTY02_07505 [Acidobacteria bacterium]|nr:hypothetical protein [Acidobacteriota bacterium]